MSGPQHWTAPDSAVSSRPPAGGSGEGAPEHPAPPGAVGNAAGGAVSAGSGGAEPVWPPEGEIPFRPLGVAELLDGSITCIRRNPRPVLGLSVLITAIVQLLNSLGGYLVLSDAAQEELTPEPLMRTLGAQATLGALGMLMSAYGTLVLAGLLGPVVARTLVDRPVTLRQVWRDVRPAFGRLLVTAAVVLAIALLAAALPLLPFVALLATGGPAAVGVLAALAGFPVAIALMIWLYVLLVPALPAVVMERLTVAGALRRAWWLSRGRWWRSWGTLLLALIITVFMGFLALRLPFLVAQLILFGEDTTGGALLGSLAVDTLGRIVSWSLIIPFDAGVIALLYADRRMRREGFDLELHTRAPDGLDPADLSAWRPVEFPAAPAAPGYPPPVAPAAPFPPQPPQPEVRP
ncbi:MULTISPECIES: glycerophosphoryl diester phosphodiesterase membrane domain-containing protein [Thermomonospora]|uniref:MFS family permease n=1 Tax=Thermomonospora cellulosilytica TaxID=1411118 RepID=A0A7W3N5G7_9ACTN|nr:MULTISPECIES: glycerophosphoryl diester phosphodiesterase membrane domain-containing protein [Thermomonospora]MBA9007887.1 MFS family permease [Thermomonospora cellulosilytica]